MTTALRPFALNDLPVAAQIRVMDGAARTWTPPVSTDGHNRAGIPDFPADETIINLFVEGPTPNTPLPGWQWYGRQVFIPPPPVSDYWVNPIPAAYARPLSPNWYQVRPVMVKSQVDPLGPLDPDADGCICHHDLPLNTQAEILKGRSNRRFLRANFFSVSCPGLPYVQGGSSERPDMLLNWLLPKYSRDWQEYALASYAQAGYTDFLLMWADAEQFGMSIAQFVQLAQLVQSFDLRVVVSLGSKDISPRDDVSTGWPTTSALPCLQALIAAKAIDKAVWGFEIDLWNNPANVDAITDLFASVCTPADVYLYEHFSSNHDWWDTRDRTSYWQYRLGKCRGIFKQNDPAQSVALQQARLDEDQVIFTAVGVDAEGRYLDVVACEYAAALQFPTYAVTEGRGNTIGYQVLCTPHAVLPIMGFCGGAAYPDGTVI